MFVRANCTVTVNKTCAEENGVDANKISQRRNFLVGVHGDFLVEAAPQLCTSVEIAAKYSNNVFFTGVFQPATLTARDMPPPKEEKPVDNRPKNLTTCINDCSGHGECRNGQCLCDAEWYGPCCCKPLKEEQEGEPAVDPLQKEPAYPTFTYGGPADQTAAEAEKAFEQMLLEDSRFLQPPYEGTDVMLQIEQAAWHPGHFTCCRG
jgi:hypothetical protein